MSAAWYAVMGGSDATLSARSTIRECTFARRASLDGSLPPEQLSGLPDLSAGDQRLPSAVMQTPMMVFEQAACLRRRSAS